MVAVLVAPLRLHPPGGVRVLERVVEPKHRHLQLVNERVQPADRLLLGRPAAVPRQHVAGGHAQPKGEPTVDHRLQVGSGRLDRSRLTANANYYFTDTVLKDYRDSLAPLGEPQSFVMNRPPRPRGGFLNRNFTLTFPNRKLLIVTYAEPGKDGKWEQFLVMPAS